MLFDLNLTMTHQSFDKPISRTDTLSALSLSAALKYLNLSGKQICDLKLQGETTWTDQNEVIHLLSLKPQEAK